jgi:hypothetical protein
MEDSQGDTMASSAALKAAKKELRSLMKQRLSAVSKQTVDTQSKLVHPASQPLN